MRLKDFIRRALFENYSIKIEGEEKAYLLSKDGALNKFGWMHITEIDYTVIFVNKGGDYGELQDHESQVIPHLLVKDVKPVKLEDTNTMDMYGGISADEAAKIISEGMKKIKFRAWDKDAKCIVEVNSIHLPLGKPSGKDITVYNQELECYEWVYNYELMQNTGLKDIEGKEIYEGDIVEKEFVDFSNRDKFIGMVKLIDGRWCVENENKRRAYFLFNETDINSVIGNIYENPKLLNKI